MVILRNLPINKIIIRQKCGQKTGGINMARRGENIYKRKDGRWEGRYKQECDSYGKAKYRSVYARSYQEVKSKLSLLKNSPVKCLSSGHVTVKELFNDWLNAV